MDGGFLNLPNHETIQEEFGIRKMGRGKMRSTQKSMCLLSLLYDPANYMTLDVQSDHMDGSELHLLLKHLSKVEKGDILLLDRGYPSRYLFSILESKGIRFVVRMKPNWVPAKQFFKEPEAGYSGNYFPALLASLTYTVIPNFYTLLAQICTNISLF